MALQAHNCLESDGYHLFSLRVLKIFIASRFKLKKDKTNTYKNSKIVMDGNFYKYVRTRNRKETCAVNKNMQMNDNAYNFETFQLINF